MKPVYAALSLCLAIAIGLGASRWLRAITPRASFPPRSAEVVSTFSWDGLEVRLPKGWTARDDGRLTWSSTEDPSCKGTLVPVVDKLPAREDEAVSAAARLMRRRPEEIQVRQGQYGAKIYLTERASGEGPPLVIGRSLVVMGDRIYLHHSTSRYGTPLEKSRAAEQWMILHWLKPLPERPAKPVKSEA
jgi:hypothetical protein